MRMKEIEDTAEELGKQTTNKKTKHLSCICYQETCFWSK